ncbi:hypothetical protein [Comamonas composti]|uniref:hypothetical protein n=1 Tax=Comamonas composti TaxID=408558 RepID=UPI0012EC3572|nr:hypothetical protein [Comamonas composti]
MTSMHVQHQQAYLKRKRAGMNRSIAAWDGLTTAKAQELAKAAYKAVTWHYRASTAADASALRVDLVKAFAALLARQDGDHHAAAWLDAWMADMPSTWTAQYPLYSLPQSGEVPNA